MSRKAIQSALMNEINKATGRTVEVPTLSYTEAIETFINNGKIKGLSDRTLFTYNHELRRLEAHLKENGVDTSDIRKIAVKDYEKFATDLIDEGYSNTTINLRVRTAKIFGNFCVRKGYIPTNYASEVPSLKVRKQVGETFSKSQLKRILNAPNVSTFEGLRDLTMMLTFADTGMRLSELQAIRIHDIVFMDNAINVQRTKNGYARRIPLTKRLGDVLRLYLKVRGVDDSHALLFVKSDNTGISRETIQYQIREHGRRSGVITEVQCSPHVFRRTFAKFKIQAGVDVFTLQALMGHSDISELRNYVAVYSTDLDAAIEKGIE